MLSILQKNKIFYSLFTFFFFVGLAFVISYTKFEQMVFFNNHHCAFGNAFFQMASFLGEPYFFVAIIISYLFIDYSKSLTLLFSLIVSSVVVSLLKQAFDTQRPHLYFKGVEQAWNLVPNVAVHLYFSFPSGHTTTAFLLFTLLALFNKNKKFAFFYLFFATMTGISRVYLFQHFPEDILAGSFLGVCLAMNGYLIRQKKMTTNSPNWLLSNLLGRK